MKNNENISKNEQLNQQYCIYSKLIHGPTLWTNQWDFMHHVVPPQSSSVTYAVNSAERGALGFMQFASNYDLDNEPILIYDRLSEPNRNMLEERLAIAECGETAVAFATGMASISAILSTLTKIDDHIIAHRTLYGCTYSLLANWLTRDGRKVSFINLLDENELIKTINSKTKIVYLETPSNPTLEIINIKKLSEIIKEINQNRNDDEKIKIIVDNTFATPFCQRPLTLGADIVVESLTKGIGGFGTDMGGVIVCKKELRPMLLMYRKDYGGVLSPKSAWPTLVYGLPTLEIRMKKQQETALKVAQFLESHPKVARVSYPGLKSHPQHEIAKVQMVDINGNPAFGSMLYFVLKGGHEAASKAGSIVIDYLAKNSLVITLAVSLGMIKTLIEHPSSMTHAAIPVAEQEKVGIDPGGIRLSIGIEDANDIIRDLELALQQI